MGLGTGDGSISDEMGPRIESSPGATDALFELDSHAIGRRGFGRFSWYVAEYSTDYPFDRAVQLCRQGRGMDNRSAAKVVEGNLRNAKRRRQ